MSLFSCDGIFQVGLLSSYCGASGSEIATALDGDIARATNGCRYNVWSPDRLQLFFVKVNVMTSVEDARGKMMQTMITSGPDDTDEFSKLIKGVGEGARLAGYLDGDGNSHMSLFAHKSNAFIHVSSLFTSDSLNQPCTHNEADMTSFAIEVLSML